MARKTLSLRDATEAADLVKQLRASEERYLAFIRNSTEAIWRFELEKPIPIDTSPARQIELMFEYAYLAEANEAMAKMYGLESVEDITGTRLSELMPQDDPENIAYLTAFIKSGYSLSGAESHELTNDGQEKYFLNSLVGFIEDGQLIRAWGTQTDITEQREATEALRKSEERLALALKVSNTGTWEWNIRTGELTWSRELKQLFGLKPNAKVTYEKYLTLVHPEDTPKVMKAVGNGMKTGDPYTIEHRVVWADGSVHWILGHGQAFLENGVAVRMIGTSMNIDKRKNFEIELHESEKRFRNMADTAPVLIWVADTNNMGTYFNKPWLEFTGRTLEQELGIGWTEAVHPDDLGRAATYCQACFDARKEFRMEFRLRRADGKYCWVLDHGVPRYNENGTFLGYIGSCMDIEETKSTKRRQKELEEINSKLEQQRQQLVALNQSKDEFISVASHQLRTPATGVKQYIGMLLEGYGGKLTENQVKLLQTAYESNERQLRIIDDLLKIAHIDAGKVTLLKRKTDLVQLLQDIIDEQADSFKRKKQHIVFTHSNRQAFANIDPERMRMVFENLIDNASKYSPNGKKITVELKKTPHRATVRIVDQGVGISKKDIPQLFQKFSRLNNPLSTLVGGTGLGLYWVKKIVTLHEGTISVDSKLHKGSTFTITLPGKTHEKATQDS